MAVELLVVLLGVACQEEVEGTVEEEEQEASADELAVQRPLMLVGTVHNPAEPGRNDSTHPSLLSHNYDTIKHSSSHSKRNDTVLNQESLLWHQVL